VEKTVGIYEASAKGSGAIFAGHIARDQQRVINNL
jgi:hypothetical protein